MFLTFCLRSSKRSGTGVEPNIKLKFSGFTTMASTEFTVGLESSRNSSKVLKPPGGGSSDIFGTGSPNVSNVNPSGRNIPQRNVSNIFTGETQTLVSRKKQYENKAVHTESDIPAKSIQTSIRVRNPPGGKSSGIF